MGTRGRARSRRFAVPPRAARARAVVGTRCAVQNADSVVVGDIVCVAPWWGRVIMRRRMGGAKRWRRLAGGHTVFRATPTPPTRVSVPVACCLLS